MPNSYIMKRSYFLIKAIIVLLAVFLILAAAKFFFKSSETIKRSPEQVVTELNNGLHFAILGELKDIPQESFMLVDLRSQHQYQLGHLDGAVNMPLRSLEQVSERERIEQTLVSGKKVFIYAENMPDAEGAWLFLYQMGLDGVRVLQIDVQSTRESLVVTEHKDHVEMNYASLYKEMSTKRVQKEIEAPRTKKTVQTAQKKKKKAPEGGC